MTRSLHGEMVGKGRVMRIAQVAPLYASVPPRKYGGTERVVSYLTEELVCLGHEVTLFASGDSVTTARLVAPSPRSLRAERHSATIMGHYARMLGQVSHASASFDVIHFHIDFLHFPLFDQQTTPHLTTFHWRLDNPDLLPLFEDYRNTPVVSVSDSQREPVPWLNWRGTVYHGLPEELYTCHDHAGTYLAFLGLLCPEKGVDRAIEIARRANREIKIAGRVGPQEREYFERVAKPLLDDPRVDFVGELEYSEIGEFLRGAYALLFPIDWPEPFGLVMIEAMACGTPTIAYRRGSVEEVIEDGVTGFIVEDIEEAVAAVERVPSLSRKRCREVFEERFTASRMAQDYLAIYRRLQ